MNTFLTICVGLLVVINIALLIPPTGFYTDTQMEQIQKEYYKDLPRLLIVINLISILTMELLCNIFMYFNIL